jgi:3-oxoacyl-[acyl-carrier protein] reductase
MELGIEGRVAIVTGASQGIGRATAMLLAGEGVSVVVSARRAEPLHETVDAIRALGGEAWAVQADVADPRSAAVLTEAAASRYGDIDIVVNNAGGQTGTRQDRIRDFDEEVWISQYRLNVTSAVRLASACIPGMANRGWGRIVNVSSTLGREADPRFGPYGAAKAALLHVTRNLALAYASRGVLVNAVVPGLTRSEGTLSGYEAAAAASGRTPDDIERRMMELQPIAMGRVGESEEIANAIAFLCSERASWITGGSVTVDGGTLRAVP